MAGRVKVHILPHFHYDQSWLMTFDEYYHVSEKVLVGAIEFLRQYPEFKFCIDQIVLIKEIEKRNRELWKEVRKAIKDGRIELVGSGYNQPDCNLVNGESLIRNLLYGKKYARDKFGVKPTWCWMLDIFGHSAQMPQISRQLGYMYYAFARGMPNADITEFYWTGADGSSILTIWLPFTYATGHTPIPTCDQTLQAKIEDTVDNPEGTSITTCVYLPVVRDFSMHLQEIVRSIKRHFSGCEVEAEISTPSEYIAEVLSKYTEFPEVEGELQSDALSTVMPGVYSSRMWIKKAVRELESNLFTVECLSTINWLSGREYPDEIINRAWESVAYLSFHDVVTGCGIDESCDEVRELICNTKSEISGIEKTCLSKLAGKDEVEHGPINAICIFNQCAWERTCYMDIGLNEFEFASQCHDETRIPKGLEGGKCEGYLSFNGEPRMIIETTDLTPLSPVVMRFDEAENTLLRARSDELEIENRYVSIRINKASGCIDQLQDRETGKSLLDGLGNELIAEPDCGDLYHYRRPAVSLNRPSKAYFFRSGSLESVYKYYEALKPAKTESLSGCLFSELRVRNSYHWRGADLLSWEQIIRLYNDCPLVFFRTRILNNMRHFRLRISFPFSFSAEKFVNEVPFGSVNRSTIRKKDGIDGKDGSFDTWPVLNWAYLTDNKSSTAILNRGIPEHEVSDNVLFITLLRSVDMVSWGDSAPMCQVPDALEQKEYTFDYALLTGDPTLSEVVRAAAEYIYEPRIMPIRCKEVKSDCTHAITIDTPNLSVSAFRKADNSDSLILRIFETIGIETKGTISIDDRYRFNSLQEISPDEETVINETGFNSSADLLFKPYEIKTLRLQSV